MAMGMPAHHKQVRHDLNTNPKQLTLLTHSTQPWWPGNNSPWKQPMVIPSQTTPTTDHRNKADGHK